MSVHIAILVEGDTERVFKPILQRFLFTKLAGKMPKLSFLVYDGRIPTGDKLKRAVENLLNEGNKGVVALTDVYTGTSQFADAQDAKMQMSCWVGVNPNFYPHVALHDFEAWLFPFWSDIQRLAGSNRALPNANPEQVNHGKPPAYVLKEVFMSGTKRQRYVKPRDAGRILRDKDLTISAAACPELKGFLNTILKLCKVSEKELL